MKPSHLIQKKCKTKKQQLLVAFSLIDYFLSSHEVEWSIEVQNKLEQAEKGCRSGS
jgi:hypothetical protein